MRRVPSCVACVRSFCVLLLGSVYCLPQIAFSAHAQQEANQAPTPSLPSSGVTRTATATTGVAVNEGLLVTG